MKLLHVKFENFRLLRDLALDFDTTPEKRLFVVRAANESGKTTMLHGLRWALYGDRGLPRKGRSFRLHPIDWDTLGPVPITVTVDFEVTKHRISQGQVFSTRRRYRLVRTATEVVPTTTEGTSSFHRGSSTVKLFEVTDVGNQVVQHPERIVREELPPELREVFFTDGDRALSFIEADVAVSTKRKRVERAIRSLLGLGIVKDAIQHVKKARAKANSLAKNIKPESDSAQAATRLEELASEREALKVELKDVAAQLTAFDERLAQVTRKISAALVKGDQDALRLELEDTKNAISRLATANKQVRQKHSQLFRSRSVATGLLMPAVSGAYQLLNALRESGRIPNTTLPILQDRLATGTCFCGETLDQNTPGGQARHEHITKLIDESRHADAIQSTVTDLYYQAVVPSGDDVHSGRAWLSRYTEVVETRNDIERDRNVEGQRRRALEAKLDELGDTDIQGLRQTERDFKGQRDRYFHRKAVIETRLEQVRRDYDDVERERDRLLRYDKRAKRVRGQLRVTQDVTQVLETAERRIKTEELHKVSDMMNSLFLEMIGADTHEMDDDLARQQRSIIRRAEINDKFDILVHGPGGKQLNPDQDLNGASRRALTLAFILALTKVSEVEAPNLIDTPLGMTSGFVKRSILRTAAAESSQLILFLTHDEIAGCEDILDEMASTVVTLTNPVHYPRMLIHNPGVTVRKILRCECDHRNTCITCSRRMGPRDRHGMNLKEKDGV